MSFKLQDIFIGDFPIVEFFGANPATYIARYNIQGYPGIRVKMPSLTPILAGSDGFVFETGFEEAGKGKFITLVHEGFLTTYGHLNDILVQKDERVVAGQLIAHSNQSGLTDIPCLYFGIAPCDNAGTKIDSNGYGGYIDPMGDHVTWDVQNIKEPVTKGDVLDRMTLSSQDFTALSAQATNYKVILGFLKQTDFDDFIKEAERLPINIDTTPDDTTGGESVVLYLRSLADEFDRMHHQIKELSTINKPVATIIEKVEKPIEKGKSFLIRLLVGVRDFIFEKPSE